MNPKKIKQLLTGPDQGFQSLREEKENKRKKNL